VGAWWDSKEGRGTYLLVVKLEVSIFKRTLTW
jgi:hypothetical protein